MRPKKRELLVHELLYTEMVKSGTTVLNSLLVYVLVFNISTLVLLDMVENSFCFVVVADARVGDAPVSAQGGGNCLPIRGR